MPRGVYDRSKAAKRGTGKAALAAKKAAKKVAKSSRPVEMVAKSMRQEIAEVPELGQAKAYGDNFQVKQDLSSLVELRRALAEAPTHVGTFNTELLPAIDSLALKLVKKIGESYPDKAILKIEAVDTVQVADKVETKARRQAKASAPAPVPEAANGTPQSSLEAAPAPAPVPFNLPPTN